MVNGHQEEIVYSVVEPRTVRAGSGSEVIAPQDDPAVPRANAGTQAPSAEPRLLPADGREITICCKRCSSGRPCRQSLRQKGTSRACCHESVLVGPHGRSVETRYVAEIAGPVHALRVQPYLPEEVTVVGDVAGNEADEFAETLRLVGCEPFHIPALHLEELAPDPGRPA